MIDTPPFDPPYKSLQETKEGIRIIETLADGSIRILDVDGHAKLANANAGIAPAAAPRVRHSPKNNGPALFLEVPYSEKDDAKKTGAKWDASERKWYVPHGLDVDHFKRWWPKALTKNR
jgi:hypothetical protein